MLVCCLLSAVCCLAWSPDPQTLHAPTADELTMKSVPFEPGAPAAILEWEHYQDDTSGYAKEYVRIKVFTAEGARYGDVELPYYPGFQHIRALEARTIHADGTVIPFTGQTFEKTLVKTRHGGINATAFSLPDVQPGSIIEYRYIVAWSRDRFPGQSSWEVQRELPVVKERIWFKPSVEVYPSFFRYQGISKQLNFTRDHYELELENMPLFRREPFAPPDSHVQGRVDFRYTDPDVDVERYWTETGKSLSRDVERSIASANVATIAEIVGDAKSDDEKLRKIYAHVQTLDAGQAESLSYTHDELNWTFVALARTAGFNANIARAVDREDTVFSDAPDASQLSVDLAVVTIGGKPRYFDPGTKFTPFGLMRWNLCGTIALNFAPRIAASLVQTPVPSIADALMHRQADLRIDGNVIRGTLKVTWDGQSALVRRLAIQDDPEATARLAIEKEVHDWLPAGSGVKLIGAGPFQSTGPLIATLEVEMPNAASFSGSRVMMPMSVFAASEPNPFAAEQRQNILDFQYPRTINDEVTLQLPAGFAIESVPQNATNDLKAFVYKSEWQAAENKVMFKRTFVVNAVQLSRNLYGQVREFWAKSLSADQEPLVLKRELQ
jgi:hypothetical protein